MMSPLENPHCCNGCGACAQKCPKGAISMCPDAEGFFRPQTDAQKCVDCGLCAAVCPINAPPLLAEKPKAFAAYSKNAELRHTSSSGGVFSELALRILEHGGAVVGAALDPDGVVRHRMIETEAGIEALRGSKYVQSEAWHVYPVVRSLLESGREVLFSGTPCQVVGLSKYLGKAYEKLYMVDIICHGVPSPKAWRTYLKEREQKAGARVASTEFRNKTNGWARYRLQLCFENGTVYAKERQHDPFMRAFLKNLILRPSCHHCTSKGTQRASDLTLADFWGVAQRHPELDTTEGVSLVLTNTEKGARLFRACADHLFVCETEAETALAANGAYAHSSPVHASRSAFFAVLDATPFDTLVDRYCRTGLTEKLRHFAGAVKRRICKR